MRLFFAILLALLLPLQLSWAAVGEYCQHESVPAEAHHFGHHAHEHKAEASKDAGKKAGKSAIDGDCTFCHAGTPATVAISEAHVPEPAGRQAVAPFASFGHPSALSRAPDRPQ